jgi:hypothetical protein
MREETRELHMMIRKHEEKGKIVRYMRKDRPKIDIEVLLDESNRNGCCNTKRPDFENIYDEDDSED